MGLFSIVGDIASGVSNVANAALDELTGGGGSSGPSQNSSGVSSEQAQMNALQAQMEAANLTTSGYRKIQNASEDALFFLQEWQEIANAREENDHASSLGLEPPNVNTTMPDGIFGDSDVDESTDTESV